MFGISGGELVLLLLIGLVVLGPERLPRIANKIGSWLGQARRMTRMMKRQLEDELDLNNTLQLSPPKREPSTQPPVYKPPRDDDDYSPAHEPEEVGTGVSDEPVTRPAHANTDLTIAEDAEDAKAVDAPDKTAAQPDEEAAPVASEAKK